MQAHGLDFHSTFRTLCAFRPEHLEDSEEELSGKGKQTGVKDGYAKLLKEVENPISCAMPSGDALAGADAATAPVAPEAESVAQLTVDHQPKPESESTPSPLVSLLNQLTPPELVPAYSRENACRAILAWLEKYAVRILEDQDEGWTPGGLADRERTMRTVNPRFVLRQWVLEEVIAGLEKDAEKGRSVLVKALEVGASYRWNVLIQDD